MCLKVNAVCFYNSTPFPLCLDTTKSTRYNGENDNHENNDNDADYGKDGNDDNDDDYNNGGTLKGDPKIGPLEGPPCERANCNKFP